MSVNKNELPHLVNNLTCEYAQGLCSASSDSILGQSTIYAMRDDKGYLKFQETKTSGYFCKK